MVRWRGRGAGSGLGRSAPDYAADCAAAGVVVVLVFAYTTATPALIGQRTTLNADEEHGATQRRAKEGSEGTERVDVGMPKIATTSLIVFVRDRHPLHTIPDLHDKPAPNFRRCARIALARTLNRPSLGATLQPPLPLAHRQQPPISSQPYLSNVVCAEQRGATADSACWQRRSRTHARLEARSGTVG